ncbi:hypothetical protein [uncultured Tessaracoccus sp.]|uniref:hypothetical protein n=1 Tax=uncultured Tessaracoccus sp. TaxID=905023 RepID=UPI0025EED264|nr:hypothetical protein [uncultured Tessaracoccus sp.]
MTHHVFHDAAARTLLRVLAREHIDVRAITLRHDPPITVLIPDSDLYRRYLAQLGPDGASLAEVHLQEQVSAWYGDDEGPVTLQLVETPDGVIAWTRTPG